MQDLKQLEAFITVAQLNSFVAAADKLNVSKAMISRRVADLEASLQVRLLNRTTRKISLTESGRAYFERCADILNQLGEATAAVTANTAQVRGKLRINAPLSFGNAHLAPLWGAFMQQYPLVELDIVLSDRMVDTIEEGFDLTIRIGTLQASSLVVRQLASASMAACAAPKYLAQHPAINKPSDILQHKVAVYTGSVNGSNWSFTHHLGETQIISVAALKGLRCNSGDSVAAASIAGYGLCFNPMFLVENALKTGTLVRVLPEYGCPVLGIYALYPSRKHLSGKVRAMVDFLAQQFANKRWE
jgi:DNA-binding transcriptional LysR family regulator